MRNRNKIIRRTWFKTNRAKLVREAKRRKKNSLKRKTKQSMGLCNERRKTFLKI